MSGKRKPDTSRNKSSRDRKSGKGWLHILQAFKSLFVGVMILLLLNTFTEIKAQIPHQHQDELMQLENPISATYLKKNLRQSSPRLILTPSIEKELKKKIKTEPVVKNYYAAIKRNAAKIQTEPLLKRNMIGRRLLSISREMLYRMGILAIVYRIEQDPRILARINEEIIAVCQFSDWNPSHYLDVAEMSLAVALAVDWVGKALPQSTLDLAMTSLIEKGIKPSYNQESNVGWWINGTNNWNQVCHGGMIAASIVIAERDAELAAKTISRALDGMPNALKKYGPDGVYPEGPTYWGYGTSFSAITSSMLKTALGKDFGLAEYPSFLESADFYLLSIAPSGRYYNFADCADKRSKIGDITLAWFAAYTGNPIYLEKERFLQPPPSMGKLSRLAGPGLVWLSQFEPKTTSSLPLNWKGDGDNPIVIFREDSQGYYFGGKGGRGSVNHGNLDAGSFIFELDGVRWVVDPGNQSYHTLEKTGFNLWEFCQQCQRWTLLTKNNFGHSTLTFNNALHLVDGFAPIVDFKDGAQPEATIDLSAVFGSDANQVKRRFIKTSKRSLLIEDQLQLAESVESITWQLMTTAEVEIIKGGAVLRQDGKHLTMKILSDPELSVSLISLDPPPLKLDRRIHGLKRLEIRMPAYLLAEGRGKIAVLLTGE